MTSETSGGKSARALPLPPRSTDGSSRSKRKSSKRSVTSLARKVAAAPSKLMQRVNQELYKRNAELAVRNKTLALLRRLDEISLTTVKIEEMAEDMTGAIAVELGYDLVSLAMVDTSDDSLQWLAVSSSVPWAQAVLEKISRAAARTSMSKHSAVMLALYEERTQFSEDLREVYPPIVVEHITAAQQHQQGSEPIRYSIVYPLRFGKQVLGLLTISSSRSLKSASDYEHESIGGIVGLVALAMYKAELYEDLQETTAQLVSANARLQELDKAKSEFLSIASHQLYTPLTAIRGYLSMMKEGDFGVLPEQQAKVLDILTKSSDRLIALIKNLLDISRIESGRLELNIESMDLVFAAKELVQDLLPNAIKKGLQLQFHPPAQELAHVVADPQRLRQVLLNFVDNAIKYTERGRVDVRVRQEGDELIFSVEDTGKGITQEEIDRLFTKFTRVGGASRFHTEGTGLGLYVARQIVHEHRGEVDAQSSGTNKGSTFNMRLPVEGSAKSLKLGDKPSVVIKAADAHGPASAA